MTPYKHQVEGAAKAFEILKTYGLVYFVWEERTGKTLTSILTCEHSDVVTDVFVITSKKAIPGWLATIKAYKSRINFTVVNFEQVHKYDSSKCQIVIIDEAHVCYGKAPVPGQKWSAALAHTRGKYLIYLSATPAAQGSYKLFNQLKLCSWGPWEQYRDFYAWFRDYGIPRERAMGSIRFMEYTRVKEDLVRRDLEHLMLSCSRKELGFEFEPEDQIIEVELDESTKKLYREMEETSGIEVEDELVVADTPSSLMLKLHQIEGGTIKGGEKSYVLPNKEKIDAILDRFGDSENLVIFYHYRQEEVKLKQYFKKAKILQGTSYAEGVDLSMYDHLVIYSMNFSTSKYTQRRARQANAKRDKPIIVYFLNVKGAISSQVYKAVAKNKKNFVDSMYEKGLV